MRVVLKMTREMIIYRPLSIYNPEGRKAMAWCCSGNSRLVTTPYLVWCLPVQVWRRPLIGQLRLEADRVSNSRKLQKDTNASKLVARHSVALVFQYSAALKCLLTLTERSISDVAIEG